MAGVAADTARPVRLESIRWRSHLICHLILGDLLRQQLWSPTLATQGWGTLDLPEVWIQNRRQSRVPHIWRALCARCGKPQISPLRCAPVEMTKIRGNCGARPCLSFCHSRRESAVPIHSRRSRKASANTGSSSAGSQSRGHLSDSLRCIGVSQRPGAIPYLRQPLRILDQLADGS